MALSEKWVLEKARSLLWNPDYTGFNPIAFARAIEAEVRKDDEALIRQMMEALDEATTYTASAMWSPSMTNECKELIAKGRTRLEGKT